MADVDLYRTDFSDPLSYRRERILCLMEMWLFDRTQIGRNAVSALWDQTQIMDFEAGLIP